MLAPCALAYLSGQPTLHAGHNAAVNSLSREPIVSLAASARLEDKDRFNDWTGSVKMVTRIALPVTALPD